MSDTLHNPNEMTDMLSEREADALEIGRASGEGESEPAMMVVRPKHVPDSSYQNYLFGKAGQEDRPAWSDSIKGRAGIRLISRGIVGAAFFTIGGRYARQQIEGYNPQLKPTNALQGIAKGIDMSFGRVFKKGIEGVARLAVTEPGKAAEIAEDTMRFRQSREFKTLDAFGLPLLEKNKAGSVRQVLKSDGTYRDMKKLGRSYGADVVSFTFDFAAASVGDATTRNLFQVFDPNVKKSWLLNDDGNAASHGERKHIDWGKWAKATAGTSWRIFSKNQGEDWAAAIPYAFQMKFQSKLLNSAFAGKRTGNENRFEGHDIVFDQGWNGGAYRRHVKRDAAGNITEAKIVGDYQLAGAIDLHARFVGYNWYTLMFREGYDRIGHALTEWKDNGFAIHAPKLREHFNPITSTVDAVAHSGRYLVKSFIKANMYMNPAVIPFWFLRTSQSKWRGENYIEPNANGILAPGTETHIFTSRKEGKEILNPYDPSHYANYPANTVGEKFEKGFSRALNFVGKGQYVVGKAAGDAANTLAAKGILPKSKWLEELMVFDLRAKHPTLKHDDLLVKGRKNFMHEYTDASIAYTPYMFAKAELGLRVDDSKGDGKPGQMDTAIYKFMDNVASFNAPASWRSLKQMWNLGTHFERDVTMREGGSVPEVQSNAISTQTLPQAAAAPAPMIPNNTVTAATVEPTNFGRRAYDTKPPIDEDKNWAQSVVGNDVNPAQILTAGATRH